MTDALTPLGWTGFFEAQWQARAHPEEIRARVATEHRGVYEVWSEGGRGWARLPGKLRRELGETEKPAVGDWVSLDTTATPDRTAFIQHVFARRTAFTRGSAGRESKTQIVAANVDVVFLVAGLDQDFNIRRIERYLARIVASGATPVVLLSKADLSEEVLERVQEVQERSPDVTVTPISALAGEGVEHVRAHLGAGITAALVGSSGAGKSTLVNALLGEARMTTQAVSDFDGKGRHTTTHRQLLVLPGGGLLLDTPGMRELQLLDPEGLNQTFDDVEALAAGCRFTDCGHEAEPGCAVRAAVAAGELEGDRLEHFRQLRAESAANVERQDKRLRRTADRAVGKVTQQGQFAGRKKRGED